MPLPNDYSNNQFPQDPKWMSQQQAQIAGLPVSYFTATDISFLNDLLPQYTIENRPVNGMYCTSKTGISDATDEWLPIFQAIKKHFGTRFSEVFHTTCSDHLRFTIYLKKI